HSLPAVLQAALSGAHVPSEQMPEQHSPSLSQATPSEMHWSPEHWKSTQASEQQSGPTEQSPPAATHVPGTRAHRPEMSSQNPVQHSSAPPSQAVPVAVHSGFAGPFLSPQPVAVRASTRTHRT